MNFPKEFPNGITVVYIKNARWADKDQICIDADVTFKFANGSTETVPYTACPFDTEMPHCAEIYEHCAGLMVAPWERPPVHVSDLEAELAAILPDVLLGLATTEEMELAKLLRLQIKAMS